MTREEAIINLKLSQNRIGGIKREEWNALQMAIEALSVANLKEKFESADADVYEDYEHATLVDIKEPLKPSADAVSREWYDDAVKANLIIG